MEELVVMAFGDKHRALEVLPQLQRLKFPWSSDLSNAVAVEVEPDGRLRVMHSHMLDPSSGVDDVMRWKALLSAIVPLPHAPRASAPEVSFEFRGINSAASAWMKDSSLDQDFVRNVAAVLQPGNSAIFAMIQDWQLAEPVLSGYSHLVLHTTTVAWKEKKAN
ncbi:MAG: hypothetical protein WCC87_18020 [Candidatus Korobacteraceae bacterium]